MNFTFSVGCSGSGKTTYGNKLKSKNKNLVIVCPDDIRAEMGDVSDQSHGFEVFKKANSQIEAALKAGKDVYYSATNLTKKSRKDALGLCKKYNADITAILFMDSSNPELCEKRVSNDLDNGINRSNTMVKLGSGETVVQMQSKRFNDLMKQINMFKQELAEASKNYKIIQV